MKNIKFFHQPIRKCYKICILFRFSKALDEWLSISLHVVCIHALICFYYFSILLLFLPLLRFELKIFLRLFKKGKLLSFRCFYCESLIDFVQIVNKVICNFYFHRAMPKPTISPSHLHLCYWSVSIYLFFSHISSKQIEGLGYTGYFCPQVSKHNLK